jgi:hypothetical protein
MSSILVACIPATVLNAASESPPLLPVARSAGPTLIPSVGSGRPRSASAYRVDSQMVGAHALRVGHEIRVAPPAEVGDAARLRRRPFGLNSPAYRDADTQNARS